MNQRKKKQKLTRSKIKERKLNKKIHRIANNLKIKKIPDDELIKMVLNYNEIRIKENLHSDLIACENFSFKTPNKEILNKWIVNYICCNLVIYNNEKVKYYQFSYPAFKKAVLYKVAIRYPKYAAECQRQSEMITVK